MTGPIPRVAVPAILVLLAAAGILSYFERSSTHAVSTPRTAHRQGPNIIMLMTDDQTVADLSVMPKVRSLIADHGVTFSNSFVSYSLCCPSRTTYLTGQYAHNHGVLSNGPPIGGYAAFKHERTIFPLALQRAGYRTIHIGKYLNGYGSVHPTKIPPGWSDWHATIGSSTYAYYGFTLNDNGTLDTYKNREDQYQTDVYGRLAADIIRKQAGSTQPFFLNVAFVAPHTGGRLSDKDSLWERAHTGADGQVVLNMHGTGSAVPPKRYSGHFRDRPLPTSPSFDEADVSDKPSFIRVLAPFNQAEVENITERYRARLEALLAVDDAVQEIFKALTDTGQLKRTVILFTSDNGYLQGQHRIPFGKYLPYEESIRVPLLIRGPGLPQGVTRQTLVANIDLAPTILDIAHVIPLIRMDGRSLLPIIRDPVLRWGRGILLEAFAARPSKLQQPYQGIRTPRYVYWEYGDGERELYDLQADPYQLNNLQNDPAYQGVERELAKRLTALSACAGPDCSK